MGDTTPDGHRYDRIDAIIDAVADLARQGAETDRRLAVLTADVASLTRVVRLHLIHDHGYEDPDANDDT
jgi:hypothetical protein